MNDDNFVILVKQMRDAQKAYFKGRLKSQLEYAKSLERAVDAEVKAHGLRSRN